MTAIVVISGFVLSLGLLRFLVRSRLARYFGDTPDHRKVHQQIVPRIGGLALTLSTLALLGIAAAASFFPDRGLAASLAFACVFLLAAGTLDDLQQVGYKIKFLLQFLLSGALVLVFGNHFETIAILGHEFNLGNFGLLFSLFWFVGLMNAFNIIDGIDGLAGGVALCALASVGLLAHADGDLGLLWAAAGVGGVILGFLPFNFHLRTKAFLGDTGSQFLGVSVALLALKAQELPSVGHSALIPFLLVGYPVCDVGVAMTRRFFKCGQRRFSFRFTRMFQADNDHLHHRLVYLGLSHLQSTALLVSLAAGMAASAFVISNTGSKGSFLTLAYLAAALTLVLNRLGYIGPKPLTLPRAKPNPARIVGAITGSELFLHSLRNYQQSKFGFLQLPMNLTKFIGPDLSAVILYNETPERFDEQWTALLRMQEFDDRPAVVVAGAEEIARIRAQHPDGYQKFRFLEKPLRIPDLIRELDAITPPVRSTRRERRAEPRFSLAELALRNNVQQ